MITGVAPEIQLPKDSAITLTSLLYVSRSTIPQEGSADGLNNIVATAHVRNPTLGLTGALLFTGDHFAQVLEGSDKAIDTMMKNINRDTRHDQILIVDHSSIIERRFASWSLAYFGPSRFVSGHVTRLLSDPLPKAQRQAAEWLIDLLWEFSKDLGVPQNKGH